MSDYEKLKIAHELADKYAKKHKQMVRISYEQYKSVEHPSRFSLYICDWHDCTYESIDYLIAKLHEITQPEPKYKVGDEVWFYGYEGDKIQCDHIRTVEYGHESIFYHFKRGTFRYEEYLYPTKSALVEAQIAYWQSLREPPIKHEECYCGQMSNDGDEINTCGYCRPMPGNSCGSYIKFEGPIQGFVKAGQVDELLEEGIPVDGSVSLSAVGYRFRNDGVYRVIKPDSLSGLCAPSTQGTTGPELCVHQSDRNSYFEDVRDETSRSLMTRVAVGLLKCIKCGEFYR